MDVVERRFYKSRSTLSIIAAGLGHSAPVLRAAWVPVFAFIPQHIAESRSVPLPSDPPYTCISALQSPSSEISKEPSTAQACWISFLPGKLLLFGNTESENTNTQTEIRQFCDSVISQR